MTFTSRSKLALFRNPLTPMALLAFGCLSLSANAQDTELEAIPTGQYENWYQVELIIFKRADLSTTDKEVWTKNIALAYPPNVQHLHDPTLIEDEPLDDIDAAEIEFLNDEDPTEPFSDALAPHPDIALNPEMPEQAIDAELEEAALEAPAYSPYTYLPQSEYIMGNASNAIARESGMSILFHQSWRQPINEAETAPAIVIAGGEQYGEHKELEGTVTFSRGRYLHINTDLWLTRFTANYGQETEHWPELPVPPQPISIDPLTIGLDLSPTHSLQQPILTEALTQPSFTLSLEPTNTFNINTHNNALTLNNFSNLTEKPFLVEQIVPFNQKRRMRSEELHFIDHPKLGVLVKISPFKPELLEENINEETPSIAN